jgi:hypothetical protein
MSKRDQEQSIRDIIAGQPSEMRIIEIERDIKAIRERLSVLENERNHVSAKEKRSFDLKMTIIIALATLLSGSLLTYALTKLHLLP